MGQVVVTLPDITKPIKGDAEKLLKDLQARLKQRSLSELDAKYGGESWCSKIQSYGYIEPNPGVMVRLVVSDNYD